MIETLKTILLILVAWFVLSIPVALLVGAIIGHNNDNRGE